MKKLILLVLLLSSCTTTNFQKDVVITDISGYDSGCLYFVTPQSGFQDSFYADCGLFNVGDTVDVIRKRKSVSVMRKSK